MAKPEKKLDMAELRIKLNSGKNSITNEERKFYLQLLDGDNQLKGCPNCERLKNRTVDLEKRVVAMSTGHHHGRKCD